MQPHKPHKPQRAPDVKFVYQLPLNLFLDIRDLLDINENWEKLAALCNCTQIEIAKFRRLDGSPANALLDHLGNQNLKVERLFLDLGKIELYRGMDILKPYVKKEYHHFIRHGPKVGSGPGQPRPPAAAPAFNLGPRTYQNPKKINQDEYEISRSTNLSRMEHGNRNGSDFHWAGQNYSQGNYGPTSLPGASASPYNFQHQPTSLPYQQVPLDPIQDGGGSLHYRRPDQPGLSPQQDPFPSWPQQLPPQQTTHQQLPYQQMTPQQMTPRQLPRQQMSPQQLPHQQMPPHQLSHQQIFPQQSYLRHPTKQSYPSQSPALDPSTLPLRPLNNTIASSNNNPFLTGHGYNQVGSGGGYTINSSNDAVLNVSPTAAFGSPLAANQIVEGGMMMPAGSVVAGAGGGGGPSRGHQASSMAGTSFQTDHDRSRNPSNASNLSAGSQIDNLRILSPAYLDQVTDNWKHKIGAGGYGEVFKGNYFDLQEVAVKRIRRDRHYMKENQKIEKVIHDTYKEIAFLNRGVMKYIIPIVAFAYDHENFPCIITEFMPNGSLADRLMRKGGTAPLTWRKRFDIAEGTANGLTYLHMDCNGKRLVHGDIKPANILLDKEMMPKIADFGLAREIRSDTSRVQVSAVSGTEVYLPREYLSNAMLHVKVDTYSFGILMFEMISGKPPSKRLNGKESLLELFQINETLDWNLVDESVPTVQELDSNIVKILHKMAKMCSKNKRGERPEMEVVFKSLKECRQPWALQEQHDSINADRPDQQQHNQQRQQQHQQNQQQQQQQQWEPRVQEVSPANLPGDQSIPLVVNAADQSIPLVLNAAGQSIPLVLRDSGPPPGLVAQDSRAFSERYSQSTTYTTSSSSSSCFSTDVSIPSMPSNHSSILRPDVSTPTTLDSIPDIEGLMIRDDTQQSDQVPPSTLNSSSTQSGDSYVSSDFERLNDIERATEYADEIQDPLSLI